MNINFAGYEAFVFSYCLSHGVLTIRLQGVDSEGDQFLKCWFTCSFPQRLHWTISQLTFHRIKEHCVVILDESAGIVFCCREATLTIDPALRGVSAVTE
jgi:hypothetical protein